MMASGKLLILLIVASSAVLWGNERGYACTVMVPAINVHGFRRVALKTADAALSVT